VAPAGVVRAWPLRRAPLEVWGIQVADRLPNAVAAANRSVAVPRDDCGPPPGTARRGCGGTGCWMTPAHRSAFLAVWITPKSALWLPDTERVAVCYAAAGTAATARSRLRAWWRSAHRTSWPPSSRWRTDQGGGRSSCRPTGPRPRDRPLPHYSVQVAEGGQPLWWGWYNWPGWWRHFNGIGRITWTVKLDPGKSTTLSYKWHYFWR
jgi:hypothetical protein